MESQASVEAKLSTLRAECRGLRNSQYYGSTWLFPEIWGILFLGVLILRALICWVYIRTLIVVNSHIGKIAIVSYALNRPHNSIGNHLGRCIIFRHVGSTGPVRIGAHGVCRVAGMVSILWDVVQGSWSLN